MTNTYPLMICNSVPNRHEICVRLKKRRVRQMIETWLKTLNAPRSPHNGLIQKSIYFA